MYLSTYGTVVELLRYRVLRELRATKKEKNFIEPIKTPIFLEAALAKANVEPQSNFEEK